MSDYFLFDSIVLGRQDWESGNRKRKEKKNVWWCYENEIDLDTNCALGFKVFVFLVFCL